MSETVVRKEFFIERQGKMFVLYAGLLDAAHAQGLKRIDTELIQLGSDDNGDVTVFKAVVETEKGVFTGYGDADPTNTTRMIIPHIKRMAETRAKARALRDAVNVGVASVEELGEDEDVATHHAPPPPRSPSHSEFLPPAAPNGSAPRPAQQSQQQSTVGSALASPAQVRAIYGIGRDQYGMSDSEIDQRSVAAYGVRPAELTKRQASEFIGALQPSSAKV